MGRGWWCQKVTHHSLHYLKWQFPPPAPEFTKDFFVNSNEAALIFTLMFHNS